MIGIASSVRPHRLAAVLRAEPQLPQRLVGAHPGDALDRAARLGLADPGAAGRRRGPVRTHVALPPLADIDADHPVAVHHARVADQLGVGRVDAAAGPRVELPQVTRAGDRLAVEVTLVQRGCLVRADVPVKALLRRS